MSRNLVAPWKITTVLNAIDTERFKPINQVRRDEILLDLGTTPNAILLGIVGNVIPRKGHVDAVKALATLVERFPETRLVIVGRGSTEDVKEVQQVADEVGVRGRQWVQENLSPEPHFDSVERIFSDVAEAAKRSGRQASSKSAA